jgi:chromosome segregation ATPase
MDLDERLGALTQTVELLASFHKDNEKRMERLMTAMEGLGKTTEGLQKKNDRLEGFVTEIAEGTARLLHVAEMHEERIDRLEGRRPTA